MPGHIKLVRAMNYDPTVVNWVSIENPQSGLFVTLSKAENGAQICLEVDDDVDDDGGDGDDDVDDDKDDEVDDD